MNAIDNTPDQHGFVLFGSKVLYLDHLPMFFMENHMYHVILEVHLPEDVRQQYLDDQKSHPDSFYILGNLASDKFTIPSVAIGEIIAFQADIFRGLPSDPNTDPPLIHNVRTEKRIIRKRHFDYNIDYPANLTYVLFGNEEEAFLSHYLSKQPDFMDVAALNGVPDWLQLEQLKMGVDVNFSGLESTPPPCSPPLSPITYEVSYEGQDDHFPVTIARDIFFSTAVPNSTDPCN